MAGEPAASEWWRVVVIQLATGRRLGNGPPKPLADAEAQRDLWIQRNLWREVSVTVERVSDEPAAIEQPHWEHGYRTHGFWLGLKLLGRVGIGPRCTGGAKHGYHWNTNVPKNNACEGTCKTLRQAKRAVEKALVAAGVERVA